jgi:hypothetical protein
MTPMPGEVNAAIQGHNASARPPAPRKKAVYP